MLLPDEFSREIKQPERFIQSALDALSAHIAILDEDGIIIGVNAAWCRFADDNHFNDRGYGIGTDYLATCDRASGRNSREAGIVARGIHDVMNYRLKEFSLEYPCHGNRQKRWFVMHVTRFNWEGSPRYIIAHQNVTELKQVQVELEESKRRIQDILDNVINGIITLNERGVIESVNPAAARIFGYETIESMFDRPVNLLLAEPERSIDTALLLKMLEADTDHDMTGRRCDGSKFPMYLAISKVQLGHRRIFTAIIQDVTERKRMEVEILENEKLRLALEKERELRDLKNRFITMMSHELRTPLASILLSSDMLKLYSEKASPEEKLLYLNNIQTQVEHLTELIKDVQTISRDDGSNTTFMPEMTDLVVYCRDMIDEFNLIHHQSHRIFFRSVKDVLRTMIDQKLMRQILTNLLSNAMKYSPEGNDIQVEIKNGGHYAYIYVNDKGIGISEEDQERLFQPFHRGSNVDNLPGTGLGLSIAKQAIELHGGEISLESVLNVGTTVRIRLPIMLG